MGDTTRRVASGPPALSRSHWVVNGLWGQAPARVCHRWGERAQRAIRAPAGELVHLSGGHYTAFFDDHDRAVEAELAFLERYVLGAQPTATIPPA
jgi:hypothetical protein